MVIKQLPNEMWEQLCVTGIRDSILGSQKELRLPWATYDWRYANAGSDLAEIGSLLKPGIMGTDVSWTQSVLGSCYSQSP